MNISWYKEWMSLKDCPFQATPLGEDVYKLSEQLYVFTRPTYENFEKGENSPYITLLVIAGSDGAALRNLCSDASLDDGAEINNVEPTVFGLSSFEYGVVKKAGDTFESANYGNDGHFVEVSVSYENVEFCYRCNKVKNNMQPYAIVLRNAI